MKRQMKIIAKMLAVATVFMFVSCSTTRPVAVTSNPVGNKCGEARTVKVFGIGGGNNGINAAAKKGGITAISHVDYNTTVHFLGIVTVQTTRVYGE